MAITASRCSRLIGSSGGCRGRGTALIRPPRPLCRLALGRGLRDLVAQVDRQRSARRRRPAPSRHAASARRASAAVTAARGRHTAGRCRWPTAWAEGVERRSRPATPGLARPNAGSAPRAGQQRLDHGLPTPASGRRRRKISSMRASIATQQSAGCVAWASLRVVCVLRHQQQAVQRQHRLQPRRARPCATEQAAAQAGEGAGPAAEADRGPPAGGSRRAAAAPSVREAAAPRPMHRPAFEDEGRAVAAQGDAHRLGGGVDGEQAWSWGQWRSIPVAKFMHAIIARHAFPTLLRLATASSARRGIGRRSPPAPRRGVCGTRPAKLPPDAVVVVVLDASTRNRLRRNDGRRQPSLADQAAHHRCALELLGPAWSWNTPVWLHGTVNDGVLEGNLVIRGGGDPLKLVPSACGC